MRNGSPLLALLLLLAGCDRGASNVHPSAPDAQLAAPGAAPLAPVALRPLPPPEGRKAVPGFDGATAWLNIDHPLSLGDLKGRVVVVDFWTSCCINCIHTLPVLAAIEKRFENEPVVVVGVHSPKFDAESERERLRAAVAEYSISHPVVVDGSMRIWNAWGITSWPSVLVLDAHGRVVWAGGGEPNGEDLASVVASALAEGAREGAVNRAKIAGIRPEKDDSGALAFPGKVIAMAGGGLALSDTSHHRVVLIDGAGKVSAVIGGGLAGKTDGSYGEASFRKPQGLAQLGETLYVADTENHEIRAIDLRTRMVSTVAGTGELGHGALTDASQARATSLRSPWDLVVVADTLYVALAGSHQIAVFSPKDQTMRPFAGDGRERRKDGRGLSASFAQPSGLATDGAHLYVADSETSSVRVIDVASAAVRTVVGKDLFVFGDVDGTGEQVRLQHPIGIAWGAGSIWVADTYNSKIKRIDPMTGATRAFAGGSDRKDLFEPNGLLVRAGEVLVADTNHHRLVSFPLAGGAARPLVLADLSAPSRGVAVAQAAPRERAKPEERLQLAEVRIPRGASIVHVAWQAPAGTGVNEGAPFRARWIESSGLTRTPDELRAKGSDVQGGFDVPVSLAAGAERARLVGDVDLVVCDVATHRVCVPLRREVDIPFRLSTRDAGASDGKLPLPDANAASTRR